MVHRVCCDDFQHADRVCCDEQASLTVSAVMQGRVCCDDFRLSTHLKCLRHNDNSRSSGSILEDITKDISTRRLGVRKKKRFALSRSFGSMEMEMHR